MVVSNIKVYENISDEEVFKIACKKNNIKPSDVRSWNIYKKSIDSRDKNDVHFNYSLKINLISEPDYEEKNLLYVNNKKVLNKRPVVVGAGPARAILRICTCFKWL